MWRNLLIFDISGIMLDFHLDFNKKTNQIAEVIYFGDNSYINNSWFVVSGRMVTSSGENISRVV